MKTDMIAWIEVEVKDCLTDEIVGMTSGRMDEVHEFKFNLELKMQTDLYIEVLEVSFFYE